VRHEQQRRATIDEERFHPLDRIDVEVVGGFVEQQDVGLPHEGAGQQRLAFATARRRRERGVCIEAQMLEHRLHARLNLPCISRIERVMQPVQFTQRRVTGIGGHAMTCLVILREERTRRTQPRRHDLKDRAVHVARNVLLEPRHGHAARPHHLARVRRDRAVQQLHERALARAISAQQTHAFAALDAECRRVEHRRTAKSHAHILQTQQRHLVGSSSRNAKEQSNGND